MSDRCRPGTAASSKKNCRK